MYKPQGSVNMHEAKTHFSALVNAVLEGKVIYISKAGKPVARLMPLEEKKTNVKFGILKGKMKVSDDFDAPLSNDIIELFEGK
jgi:prevent-host-death family protein